MNVYRVTYERRNKPLCKCCSEYLSAEVNNHAWQVGHTETTDDLKAAERREADLMQEEMDSTTAEFRNIRIETATLTEWSAVNAWEEPT